jgi:lambda repressor-like predicted transcriptional regulator
MKIFDIYTAEQLRDIYNTPQEIWPDHFLHFIHDEIANELLDNWLEQATMDEYMDKAEEIIEDAIDLIS